MGGRAARGVRSPWITVIAAASFLIGCTGTTTDDGPGTSVEVPDGATVYVIRGSASAGDADVALSASVHDRDGGREAHVYLTELREDDPREGRVAGPPGTVGRVGGFELTILDIEDVDGPHDDDADGVVRELVTVAVREVAS